MIVLVDTNVLLRLDQVSSPQREIARAAIERLFDDQHLLRTVPQVLYEYWVVATRPAEANGLGFSSTDAQQMLSDHKELFPPLRDERGILERWEDLVNGYAIQGKAAHDAHLAAAMLRHGMTHILTFNDKDFARYREVTAITPKAVLAGTLLL
jgi:predicted nucleic acid-binding protein